MRLPVNRPEWSWAAKSRLGLTLAVLGLAGLSATEVRANLYICGWREVYQIGVCDSFDGRIFRCQASVEHEPIYCAESGSSGGWEPPDGGGGGGGGGGGDTGGNPVPPPPTCPNEVPAIVPQWSWKPLGQEYVLQVFLRPDPLDHVRIVLEAQVPTLSLGKENDAWLFGVHTSIPDDGSFDFNIRVESLAQGPCPSFPVTGMASFTRMRRDRYSPPEYVGAFVVNRQILVGMSAWHWYSKQWFDPASDPYFPPPQFDRIGSETEVRVEDSNTTTPLMVPHQFLVQHDLVGLSGQASVWGTVNMTGSGSNYSGTVRQNWENGYLIPTATQDAIYSGQYFQWPTGGNPPFLPSIAFPYGKPTISRTLD